jgi:hypothetical protein
LKVVDTPDSLDFLFRNHIDAFDLVENGYAIRANKALIFKIRPKPWQNNNQISAKAHEQ